LIAIAQMLGQLATRNAPLHEDTMHENIKTEIKDNILTITIDRPKVRNALNAQTVAEIGQALEAVREDASVRCVIVTGAGDKAFVAGADINELATMTPITGKATSESGQRVFRAIERFPKPVIAAVNGFALGGGCELALACHIRIASENAQLGLPEVTLGIIPGYGGTQRMARLLGKGKALELILTGDRIGAAEAERIGLVNKVVPADQLMSTAETMGRTIASRGPLAVRAAIEAVMSGSEMPFDEGQFLEATLFGLLASSEDMKEGMAAFLEKRTANFQGK
jgi:enoyl-CoA hydratase